jgi:ribosome-associated toxin RatA of RatAB toxin-antitoxin module
MSTVRKSVIVPSSCEAMFALVDDVERYPQFLPWCASTEVFERNTEVTRARLDIDYHGLRTHISTLNRKTGPSHMTLEFVDGPFRQFRGAWSFTPLGGEGCKVELSMDYAFASATLEKLLGRVFGHIAETLVESFVQRAEALAGRAPPQ